NYMFNHIGAHAYQQGELCRSIVMGGVARRFPQLAFGFLECGAGWACDLLHSLEEHWEKRNIAGLANYDPSRLDRPRLHELLAEWGGPEFTAKNSANSSPTPPLLIPSPGSTHSGRRARCFRVNASAIGTRRVSSSFAASRQSRTAARCMRGWSRFAV